MKTDWSLASQQFDDLPQTIERLKPMQDDGLLHVSPNGLEVTELGRPFIRNIAMAFDLRLLEKQPDTRLFSMTI
jgi:oxygen-independent coproporphyrinogen-3 oxidase